LGAQALRAAGFYKFAVARGHVDRSPLPRTVPQPLKAFVPIFIRMKNCAACSMLSRSPTIRDAALIRILIERLAPAIWRRTSISEALALTLADVDLDSESSVFARVLQNEIGADRRGSDPDPEFVYRETATAARRGSFTFFGLRKDVW
jgi:hypothetical protein